VYATATNPATEIIADLAIGNLSASLDLPSSTGVPFGLDADNDAQVDLVGTIPSGRLLSEYTALAAAYVVSGDVKMMYASWGPSFGTAGRDLQTLSEYVAPVEVMVSNGTDPAVAFFTPYPTATTYITYANNENGVIGDSSYRQFTVTGATTLRVTVTYQVENTWDYLVINNLATTPATQIARVTGPTSGTTTATYDIPSNTFSMAVDSDSSGLRLGYRIDSIVVDPAPAP
jgi:hypothetical protein